MNREAIFAALYTLVTAGGQFATTGRRVKIWTDVKPAQRPALFLAERAQTYLRNSEAVPARVTLNAELYIYTDAKDPNVIGSTQLNNLLDAIDVALAPSPVTGKQTLDGLVSHCWIEGDIFFDPGDVDGDGMAIIPLKILVPT
ncbi:MAG: hypothetical protein K8U57_07530 [Planctomycetes bacterium]|nr:hypothetical protein [Planctomycetota bacterium]